jgi:hypothetical protein
MSNTASKPFDDEKSAVRPTDKHILKLDFGMQFHIFHVGSISEGILIVCPPNLSIMKNVKCANQFSTFDVRIF